MSTDWIPVGSKTPRCEEVVRIAGKVKWSRRETFGALVDFWIWVTQQSDNGLLEGYSLENLPLVIEGTDLKFWQAVADEQWIVCRTDGLFVPENREHPFICKGSRARLLKARRQSNYKAGTSPQAPPCAPPDESSEAPPQAPSNARPTITSTYTISIDSIDAGEIEELKPAADQLFCKSGYSGKKGSIFWKAAALVRRGKLPFDVAEVAASRTRSNASDNPPAFFRKTLVSECASRGIAIEDLLGSVRFPRSFDRGPPASANGGSLGVINELLSARKDSP